MFCCFRSNKNTVIYDVLLFPRMDAFLGSPGALLAAFGAAALGALLAALGALPAQKVLGGRKRHPRRPHEQ